MSNTMRILGAPNLYLQGPGAIERIADIVANLGKCALLVADPTVERMLTPQLTKLLTSVGVAFASAPLVGEVTPANVARLAGDHRADVVIAAGGGKGIDAGKAVSRAMSARLVTLPTAASNDGPTSRIFIFYDDDHKLLSAERVPRNPDAVIVDTQILAGAPRHLLVSGIGDALVKRYEAAQCVGAGRPNMFGGRATLAAVSLANVCEQVLREHAVDALAVAGSGKPDESFEKVIEACILLAGLGFEGSGLSIAHAMTRGLSALPATAEALHGRQVAYALLVQFVLENRSAAFMADQFAFYAAVGLPTSLAELGLPKPSADDLRTISSLTHKAPHTRNFERPLSEDELTEAMLQLEQMRQHSAG
ncbi:iron-containing alcohol dehydrogenase [Halomonas organivorans]|uniref:Glycerol dehydrogenase n=1 Tax=Halomonas organivorans TaxID=257772 RepID=A0A7W5G7P5_9GAMM|nr:glycerol dehydrogenase [Halomonas organivorans]